MREIVLIRHGHAEHLVNGLTGGWTDTHLTDLGRGQARLTGEQLKEMMGGAPFRFYSSDLARAAETATIIAESLGVSPVLVSDLRELNNGAAAGLTEEEAKKIKLPQTYPALDWVPYPGAESWRMMAERICSFLDRIAGDDADTVLLVTHGNAGVAVINWWLRLSWEREEALPFQLDPCGISRLTVNEWGERTVAMLNYTGHLLAH